MIESRKRKDTNRKPRFNFLAKVFLGGTLNHYGNELSKDYESLSTKVLEQSFHQITLEPEKLEKLERFAAKGRIIYALPYRSPLDFLFLNWRLRRTDLPTPEIIYNTNVYRFQPLSSALRVGLSRILYLISYGSWPILTATSTISTATGKARALYSISRIHRPLSAAWSTRSGTRSTTCSNSNASTVRP